MFSTQKAAINLPAAKQSKQHVTKLHQWTARHAGWQVVQGSALYLIPPGEDGKRDVHRLRKRSWLLNQYLLIILVSNHTCVSYVYICIKS